MAPPNTGMSNYEQIGLFETGTGSGYPSITTSSGRFDFTVNTVNIADIAYALSSIRRYGGHARPRINVAQHSLVVAALAKNPFEGLMHDAHEAYVIDMPKPLKVYLKDYQDLEEVASNVVRDYCGLDHATSEDTKFADLITLFWEAYWVIYNRGEDWHNRDEFLQEWITEWPMVPLADDHTEWLFNLAYNTISRATTAQAKGFVYNTLRPELGIPKDVDIYVSE